MIDTPRNDHESPAWADRDADAPGPACRERPARRPTARAQRLGRPDVPLAALVEQLDRRLRRVESRLATLASQAASQQESTRMICAILKDLDDPYGFGTSLDEQLACEEADWTHDEERQIGNDPY